MLDVNEARLILARACKKLPPEDAREVRRVREMIDELTLEHADWEQNFDSEAERLKTAGRWRRVARPE